MGEASSVRKISDEFRRSFHQLIAGETVLACFVGDATPTPAAGTMERSGAPPTPSPELVKRANLVADTARSRIDAGLTGNYTCLREVAEAIGSNTPNGLKFEKSNLPLRSDPDPYWNANIWAEDAGPELERVGYIRVSYNEYQQMKANNGGRDIKGTVAVTPGTKSIPPGHISISDGSGQWLDFAIHKTPNALNGTSASDATYYLPYRP